MNPAYHVTHQTYYLWVSIADAYQIMYNGIALTIEEALSARILI